MARSINQVLVSLIGNSQGINDEVNKTKGNILNTLGNLGSLATGIGTVFNGAKAALGSFTSGIVAANQTYSDLIVAASGFADVSGFAFEESEQYLGDLRENIKGLASDLGDTGSYYNTLIGGVVDDYTSKLKEADNFTKETLTESLRGFGSTVANYFENSGVAIGDASFAVNKFISATSTADLKTVEFFKSQPALISRIDREAEKLGKTFEDLTTNERLSLAENVFRINPEAQKKLEKSLTTTLGRVREQLFDPVSGFVGYLRGVSVSGQDTNVLLEVQNLVSNFLSPSGPLQAIYEGLGIFGEIGDPMEVLATAIRGINDRFLPIVKNVVDALSGVNPVSFDINTIFNRIGEGIANFINRIIEGINSYLQNTDRSQEGQIAAEILVGIGNGILSFVTSVDWLGLFSAVGGLMISLVTRSFHTFTNLIAIGVSDTMNLIGSQFNLLAVDLRSRVSLAFAQLKSIVSNIVSAISSLIGNLSGVANAISSARNFAANFSIPGMADGYIPSNPIGNILASATSELSRSPKGSRVLMANSSEAILNQGQQMRLASNLMNSNNSNIQITINGNDPMAIGREVETRLNRMFNNRSQFA